MIPEGFQLVNFVNNRDYVYVTHEKYPGSLVGCTVICAAGRSVHVVNDARGINRWYRIDEIYRKIKDAPLR